MTAFVFKDRGLGSRFVYQSLHDCLAGTLQEDAVWSASTYYGTKSPDRKLTYKEFLSIVCPHIFMEKTLVIARLKNYEQVLPKLTKIDGFAGMLCGKLERAHLAKLAQIIRHKRHKLNNADRIFGLSVYDCIGDTEKSIEQCQAEIIFCDTFIKQYVVFSKDQALTSEAPHSRIGTNKPSLTEPVREKLEIGGVRA